MADYKALAERFFSFLDPWERPDSPEELEKELQENPADAINYLLDVIEELQA